MSASVLYHAYGIKGVQYKSTRFEKKSVIYKVEMQRQEVKCPKCSCSDTCFKGQKERVFKMIPYAHKQCSLEVLLHRLECTNCKYKWWPRLSFMKGKSRMTRSFRAYILDLLQFSTILDVSRFVRVHWNVVVKNQKE